MYILGTCQNFDYNCRELLIYCGRNDYNIRSSKHITLSIKKNFASFYGSLRILSDC